MGHARQNYVFEHVQNAPNQIHPVDLCALFIHSLVFNGFVSDSEGPDQTGNAQADLGLHCPHMTSPVKVKDLMAYTTSTDSDYMCTCNA